MDMNTLFASSVLLRSQWYLLDLERAKLIYRFNLVLRSVSIAWGALAATIFPELPAEAGCSALIMVTLYYCSQFGNRVEKVLGVAITAALGSFVLLQLHSLAGTRTGSIYFYMFALVVISTPLALIFSSLAENFANVVTSENDPSLSLWENFMRHLGLYGARSTTYLLQISALALLLLSSILFASAATLVLIYFIAAFIGTARLVYSATVIDLGFSEVASTTAFVAGAVVGVYAVSLLLGVSGFLLRRLSYFLRRSSYASTVLSDSRPSILFLRSFRNDQFLLSHRDSIVWSMFGGALGRTKVEHMLVEEFSCYGPVVAIGRPGSKFLPFGASRLYVESQKWQEVVKDLAHRARYIVLVKDLSDGVKWELDLVVADDRLMKKAIFLQPSNSSSNAGHGVTLGRSKPIYEIGIFFTSDDRAITICSDTKDADAYRLALRAFFKKDSIPADIRN